jgi:hypothetical protein
MKDDPRLRLKDEGGRMKDDLTLRLRDGGGGMRDDSALRGRMRDDPKPGGVSGKSLQSSVGRDVMRRGLRPVMSDGGPEG